ncbi:hypothetical protein AB0C07_34485 [Actinoplanes missouriensis]|uniref:hypothetical protein n=1 Tax=Actinoplanes missouriensis TaxID=1866 RepID=UPI0033EE4022
MAALGGWRSVYLTLAVLLVGLSGIVRKQLPPDHRASRRTYRDVMRSLGHLFREPLFVSRGLIAFFLFASFGVLWSGLALPLAAQPWQLSTAQIGLFGLAGLAGALGATRSGRWADAGRAGPVTGGALALLAASWIATGQATWSLWLLTAAHPGRTGSVVGGYMIFYSLGSALGATVTTTVYSASGWTGSAVLGAAFALGGLLTWVLSRRMAARTRRQGIAPPTVTAG